MHARRMFAAIACLTGLTLCACGGAATPQAPAAQTAPQTPAAPGTATKPVTSPPRSLQKVTLRLDWLASGEHAGAILAQTSGLYKKAGFDARIGQGKGSALTIQTVGSGADTFGMADAATTAQLISKGAPVKVLATFVQQSPHAFLHLPGVTINSPKDLIGKTIVTSSGTADYVLLPAVLATAGVKLSQLKVDFLSPSAYPGVLKQHPGDIVLGFDDDTLQEIQKVVPQTTFTSFDKFGIDPLNESLIASTKLIRQHPNEVRRFVAATVAGYQAALKNPTAAVDAIMQLFPQSNRGIERREVTQILTMLHTPASQGKPLGWAAKSDWQSTIDLLVRYGGLKHPGPLSAYYTNSFLPSS